VIGHNAEHGVGRRGAKRVIRGGSWNNHARNARAAYRNWNHPGIRNDNLGFRLARAQSAPSQELTDQTCIASDSVGVGENQMGAGVPVGAAEAPSTVHRWPAFSHRFESI